MASYRKPRLAFFTLVLVAILSGIGFIAYIATDVPPLDEIENPKSQLSTQLISYDGVVLQNYFTHEDRVNVRLNEVSPFLVDGLVATEDRRFYHHPGVDISSILSLAIRYIRGTTSGASTITMQLSRNLFDAVGRQRNVMRKLREIIVAAIIERKFTKEEILTAYINTVSIYGNTYGVEMAAQNLFDKTSRELKLEEAATLVAMLKGQGVYNPYRNPDTVQFRRNVVINNMVKSGFLPDSLNTDSIKQLPVKVIPRDDRHVRGIAPYFREHLRLYLRDWCEERGYNIYTDGLKIYTTLDSRLQKRAEAAVHEHLSELQEVFNEQIDGSEPYRTDTSILTQLIKQSDRYQMLLKQNMSEAEIYRIFKLPVPMRVFDWRGDIDTVMTPMDSIKYYAKILESGMVSIDPTNGQIKAWVGGNDFRYFKYDHVYIGKRQVGSTFKPFVYAAALDNGRKPCDMELNQPVFFDIPGDTARWAPKNSQNNFGGKISLKKALATSQNLVTARLMKDLGPKIVAQYAYKMGIQSQLEEVPSLCLGTTDLNVLELTGAYCTFVNRGQWIEPNFVTRIEDKNGNVIERFPPETRQALSPNMAYMMVEMLRATVDLPGGSASRLRYKYDFRNEIGGKTGTTQEHSDGWYVGITPNLVTGIWVGCSDRRMSFQDMSYGQGAASALPIWAKYMKTVYEDEEMEFPQPNFISPVNYRRSSLNCEASYIADSLRVRLRGVGTEKKSLNELEDF
ncbi:MAG: transglycosylase domain-containing protein [Bacteroidota bacterium]